MSEILVFDLDDTLFLERNFVLSGFRAVADWLMVNKNVIGIYDIYLEIYQAGVRGNIFNIAFERLGIKYDNEFIAEIVQIYRQHKPNIELLEDAKEILEYFFKKKPLSIITDGYYDTQRAKIEALGIGGFFDLIVYSDANGKRSWKPSEWPYLEVMKNYKKSSSDYVYIADNVQKDFITAKKLGWKTIRIRRVNGEYCSAVASQEYMADYEVDSLIELKKIII